MEQFPQRQVTLACLVGPSDAGRACCKSRLGKSVHPIRINYTTLSIGSFCGPVIPLDFVLSIMVSLNAAIIQPL